LITEASGRMRKSAAASTAAMSCGSVSERCISSASSSAVVSAMGKSFSFCERAQALPSGPGSAADDSQCNGLGVPGGLSKIATRRSIRRNGDAGRARVHVHPLLLEVARQHVDLAPVRIAVARAQLLERGHAGVALLVEALLRGKYLLARCALQRVD